MDDPGTSEVITDNLCKFCGTNPRVYTCPRCGLGYCNVDCYKSEAHSECSESFYKQCVEDELKSQEKDPELKQKMVEILRRVHETDLTNFDSENDNASENEEDDEELEGQLDSDDEEDIPDLERRLHDVNLDNADEVWTILTDSERQEFEALVKNGEIEKLLPQWVPWWTYHIKKKLVQDMDEEDNEQIMEYPPLIDVPIFNELQKASPNVYFNLVNVIYAYAYTANYYNGDYSNCPVDAMVVFLDLCDNMKLNKVYESTESAIAAVVHNIVNCNWLPQDERTLLGFKEAANSIIQGPEERNKYFYIATALSELHRLLAAAKEEVSKLKDKAGSNEFSNTFRQRYNKSEIKLSRKSLLLCCKKLEYYLSWIKNMHVKHA
ncbi:zinc finger HIT domain-containing protein 2 [Lasioglossum baleicum]|uniref:zinc finger HIT domain-containing protein 2 n=1 Tax=Lasioglossum baleicum TaxID=434251 RepID=UPI003FCE8753